MSPTEFIHVMEKRKDGGYNEVRLQPVSQRECVEIGYLVGNDVTWWGVPPFVG